MIYFTSDTHFRHYKIIEYCKRPFKTIEEHDQELIKRWNEVVQKGDSVYHLGDVGFFKDDNVSEILDKLRGNIHLIRGNHDLRVNSQYFKDRFNFIKDYHVLERKINNKKIKVVLSHYSFRTWQFQARGGYHAFGHSHGNLKNYFRSIDVGVDCHNFYPISIENFIQKCDEQYEKDICIS